jgi:acyl-CoA synthetase (AMP-forming)/AMP-acid ligase II
VRGDRRAGRQARRGAGRDRGPQARHRLTEKELKAFCRERLAGFKVPREIHFRDALPKGGTGKILKAELREPFWVGGWPATTWSGGWMCRASSASR